MDQLLSLEVKEADGTADLVLRGELDDASVGSANAALQDVLSRGFDRVTINMRRLDFMDSTGIKFLLDARDAAEQLGVKMSVDIRSGGLVERILGVSGVETLFERRDGPQTGSPTDSSAAEISE
jgi:anti-anti-sigma factor